MPSSAQLIIAASEHDSNLYYACRFLAPDPIIYFEIRGRKHLVLSDLEIDRAKDEACVHHIHSTSDLLKKTKLNPKLPSYAQLVDTLLKPKKIKHLIVPADFPALYYEAFKKMGYQLKIKPDPFFEQRLIKTEAEKKHIRHSIIQVEKTLKEAFVILEKAKIKKNRIYYGNECLTSEFFHAFMRTKLMERGCIAQSLIIASGRQASFPHHDGSGPLIPHTPIIFDIYPRHAHTRYWADMTRTVVKGKPSDTVKKMYKAVLEANKRATERIKVGVHTSKLHQEAAKTLERYGFKTGPLNGRMQGFIHSTGHGLGLDIHELPSVSASRGVILKKGHVITIEPGLYYEKHGGIRIEDDIYVTANGPERLTKFPKFFEIDKG